MTGRFVSIQGWQSALRHFYRLLVECGSPLEVEHAQRIGLLFSRVRGCGHSVCTWSSLFSAEGLPVCALVLKGLIANDQWQRAMHLVELDSDAHDPVHSYEALTQFLISRGLFVEAASAVHAALVASSVLPSPHANASPVAMTSTTRKGIKVDVEGIRVANSLAHDALFIPQSESDVYCGLGSAVFATFPRNTQWREATDMLLVLCDLTEESLRCRLREYWATKLVYGGAQYSLYLRWWRTCSRDAMLQNSRTLRRVALFCLLKLGDLDGALEMAEKIVLTAPRGTPILPLHMMASLMQLASLVDAPDGFAVARITRLAHHQTFGSSCDDRSDYDSPHVEMFSDTLHSSGPTFRKEHHSLSQRSQKSSVTLPTLSDADAYITRLVASGRWRDALNTIRLAASIQPCTDHERALSALINEHASDWRAALLLFR